MEEQRPERGDECRKGNDEQPDEAGMTEEMKCRDRPRRQKWTAEMV